MLKRGICQVVIVAVFTFSSATLSAHEHMKEQKDKDPQQSGMMMQSHHNDMDRGKRGMGMMENMSAMMEMRHGMCPMMMGSNGAELTDQQQETLAELHGQHAKQQFMLMHRIQEPRQRLQKLMMAEQLDIDAIGQAFDNLSDLHKKALLNCLENKQEMQKIMEQ